MLEHIGITINEESDIRSFYKDLLGMEEVRKFDLDEDLAGKIFGINKTVSITLVSNDDFLFELFLSDQKKDLVYNHICISIHNRDDIIKKAESAGFSVTRIKRESKDDLLFLRDNSGNIFEIKEAGNSQ